MRVEGETLDGITLGPLLERIVGWMLANGDCTASQRALLLTVTIRDKDIESPQHFGPIGSVPTGVTYEVRATSQRGREMVFTLAVDLARS